MSSYTASHRAGYLALKADPVKWEAIKAYNRKAWQVTRLDQAVMAKRRVYMREYKARLNRTPETWLHQILCQAKRRSKKSGVCFSLTAADVVLPTHCPITKAPLAYGCRSRDRSGPSLDRIIPELGYVPGNVRVISLLANVIRQDCLDPAIFQALADDATQIAKRSQ